MSKLIFQKDVNDGKRLSDLVKQGKLNRIRSGVYTDAAPNQIDNLVIQRWHELVERLIQDPVVAFRTSVELKPVDGQVFVISSIKSRKKYTAGPLTINVIPGETVELTEQFVIGLSRSSLPRQLLENLSPSRETGGIKKALGKKWVEEKICLDLSVHDEDWINKIRDKAKQYAASHDLEKEFAELNKIISAILATGKAESVLQTPIAIATAQNEPFDQDRLNLFERLYEYLKAIQFEPVGFEYNKSAWRNLSFFESYFSNFIEGTEFEIEEAEDIVFSDHVIDGRHADSHDILNVFNMVSDYQEMITVPETADDYIQLMQERHKLIMRGRKDKNPGILKEFGNKAGSSVFVSPQNLLGTLTNGFKYYLKLPKGMPRAIYMQFLTAECHPFDDGNGRLSRIMLNAELVETEQCKIIVPTVHRDSYLNGLRQGTRQGAFRTLTKVFYQLHHYSASINWTDYGEAREQLETDKANLIPDEGVATFNARIRKFKKTFSPG